MILGLLAGVLVNGWPGVITGLLNYSVGWCVVWALTDAAWEIRKQRKLFKDAAPDIDVKALKAFGFHGYPEKAFRFTAMNLVAFYLMRGVTHLF